MRCVHVLAAVCMAAIVSGCNRPDPIRLQPTIEEPPTLASVIRISDPSTSSQLVRGFYALEGNGWRWTSPKFGVVLQTPVGARQNGAKLLLVFNLAQASIQALKSITIAAKAGGMELSPEEYTMAGEHSYARVLPGSLFVGERIEVDFAVNKFLRLPNDDRQLALVVTRIGLEPK